MIFLIRPFGVYSFMRLKRVYLVFYKFKKALSVFKAFFSVRWIENKENEPVQYQSKKVYCIKYIGRKFANNLIVLFYNKNGI